MKMLKKKYRKNDIAMGVGKRITLEQLKQN